MDEKKTNIKNMKSIPFVPSTRDKVLRVWRWKSGRSEPSNAAWTAEPSRERQMENYSDAVICLPPLSTHIQEARYKYENLS